MPHRNKDKGLVSLGIKELADFPQGGRLQAPSSGGQITLYIPTKLGGLAEYSVHITYLGGQCCQFELTRAAGGSWTSFWC